MESTKIFCGNVFIHSENLKESCAKNPIKLMYYKVKSRNSYVSENYETYGVEIVKNEYKNDNVYTESVCIDSITQNEFKLDQLIEMLKNNSVTPITLNDVINDLNYNNEL